MTSPLARVQLGFDSVDLIAANLTTYFWIAKGLNETAIVRGADSVVPGLSGRVERGRENDYLPLELRGVIMMDPDLDDIDDARADWRSRMLTYRTLFRPKRDRATLEALLENGTTAAVEARPLTILTTNEVDGVLWQGSITLEGFDDWTFTPGGS